uniref:Uncharacterized protein n=1 Tax=Arundo donax TaxID=35708 RepID=A0A0A9BAI1_ARUDO
MLLADSTGKVSCPAPWSQFLIKIDKFDFRKEIAFSLGWDRML